MSQAAFVKTERIDRVLRITIDRPEAANALNVQAIEELTAALRAASDDPGVGAVILTGAGDRAFMAGADIKHMSTLTPTEGRDWGKAGQHIGKLIEEMDKPVIAAINGVGLGGGCEIPLACDLRLMSETARLGQPEINLGILPGWGGTYRLARVVGEGMAREMIFTGRQVTAEEAFRVGLVNRVVPPEALQEEALKLATELAAKPLVALAYAKRLMNRVRSLDVDAATELEAGLFGLTFATEDQKEGMGAFLEKRKPAFKGK